MADNGNDSQFKFYHTKMRYHIMLTCVLNVVSSANITEIKLVIVKEMGDNLSSIFADGVSAIADNLNKENISLTDTIISVSVDNEVEASDLVCEAMSNGSHILLDMTWSTWGWFKDIAKKSLLPYLNIDVTLKTFIDVTDETLKTLRNATDVVLIFDDEKWMEKSLFYIIEQTSIRILVLDNLNSSTVTSLKAMRPSPAFYVIFASTANMNNLFKTAVEAGLVVRDDRWTLVFTDFNTKDFNKTLSKFVVTYITLQEDKCCSLLELDDSCTCPENAQILPAFIKLIPKILAETFIRLRSTKVKIQTLAYNCNSSKVNSSKHDVMYSYKRAFYKVLQEVVLSDKMFVFDTVLKKMYANLEHEISLSNTNKYIGRWTGDKGLTMETNNIVRPVKRFFRIGVAESIPWSYRVKKADGFVLRDKMGDEVWEGYCIDFLIRLANVMNFDYELIPNESFGVREPNGVWTGLVGDLATGQTDIIVAPLTMTSEREEVIDFVAPYFEQTGISIVIRKPVRKTSLFKFMTVLKLEVWLSIVGALTVTGVMIWLLDKYSPYSARNNKHLYSYPCREFTLKESFWFALTSFTPQGGGEAPKALSGRTLVAAYWLFVVLMLATFTANLAAFLTVERMQSPVQSLEQLSRQSRINYTVVAHSDTHSYFRNMKNAEDTLYRVWKEITLNASSDQTQYRVWDYPIKEQYGHILQAIEKSGPVSDAQVGYQKVIESEQGEFALIHDAAQIRYEVYRNCNLTEVGELFAEQPYSIAVQQGSQLNEEISRRILDFQKDRYFESLSAKYWNTTEKGTCSNTDDNEGITLESLGGVFIATLFGLALAMITLGVEIFYHKRKRNSKIGEKNPKKTKQMIHKEILTKKEFGIERLVANRSSLIQPKITYISVLPREQLY